MLSPSQVNTFIDCQARWYYGSILKLPDPPTGSLAFGKAVHYVCSLLLAARVEDCPNPVSAGEIGEAFRSALAIELAVAELREDESPAQLLEDGLRLLAMFAGQIAPQLDPVALEMPIHGEIGGVHVRGIIDVLTVSGIVDLKTSSKKPGLISPSYELQLVTYGLLAGQRQAWLITMARTKVPFVVPAHAYAYAQAHAVRRHDVCARGGVDAERPLCSQPGLEPLFAPALRVLACVRIGIRRRGQSMTREQWLLAMVERLRPVFEERGIPLAKVWANDTLVRYAKVHFAQRGFRHWRSWSSRPLSVACHLKQK